MLRRNFCEAAGQCIDHRHPFDHAGIVVATLQQHMLRVGRRRCTGIAGRSEGSISNHRMRQDGIAMAGSAQRHELLGQGDGHRLVQLSGGHARVRQELPVGRQFRQRRFQCGGVAMGCGLQQRRHIEGRRSCARRHD